MLLKDFLRPSLEALIEESNVVKEDKPLKSLAYVGMPCQIQAVRKAQFFEVKSRQEWPRRIKVTLGLFCAESFPYRELVKLVESKGMSMDKIKKWDIKGKLLGYHDEGVLKIPLKEAKKFARENCHYCLDYTAELADISVGAVGSPKGWNTVIARTPRGLAIVEGAIREGYLETRDVDEGDKGLGLLRKLSKRKFKGAWKNKAKKEEKGTKVMHLDTTHEHDLEKLLSLTTVEHRIDELIRDVVEPGLCVTCGACEASCAEKIIKIDEDGMPQKLKDCESTDCGRCYSLCPRTTLPIDLIEEHLFGSRRYQFEKRILGQYIAIFSCRAASEGIRKRGQDGGVATALLKYMLDHGIVDAAVSVTQGEKPWYPVNYVSTSREDLMRSAGTIYSTAPTIVAAKRALTQHQEFSKYYSFLVSKGFLPELAIAQEEASKAKKGEVVVKVDEEELKRRRAKIEAALERIAKPAVKMMIEQGKHEKAIEMLMKEK
jgi:coenzyme F420 hydrogenase subunit beta